MKYVPELIRESMFQPGVGYRLEQDHSNAFKIGAFLLVLLMLSGCAQQQDDSAYDLQRQIERQQIEQELISAPAPPEKRTAKAYEEIGDRYMKKYDINRAYLYYMKGLEVEPDNISLLNKQAALLLSKHKFSDAEQVYQKLLAQDASNYAVREGLGKARFGLERFDEAERDFQAALAISPNQWQSHEYLGLIASSRRDFELAVTRFKAAFELQPKNESIANNLAVSYYLSGNFTEALQLFSKLAKTSGNRKIHNNLALTYFQLGHYEEALTSFKRGSATEAEAYNNLGCEFLIHKKYVEAIEALEKAVDLYPRYYSSAQKNLDIALYEFSQGTEEGRN